MISSLQIHLVCSALITLQAAKVQHLCYSVDYKRGVLEILLNRKKALIRFSLLSFIFPSAPCGLTYVLKQA